LPEPQINFLYSIHCVGFITKKGKSLLVKPLLERKESLLELVCCHFCLCRLFAFITL